MEGRKGWGVVVKVCTKCKVEQPETNFSKDHHTADGLQYTCKYCAKAYAEDHKEQRNKYNKQYRVGHNEESRVYYKAHKEAKLQQSKLWFENNKDATRKTHATWRKAHPEVTRVYNQSRRAKKAELDSTLTTAQWKHILNEFNNTCAYCGAGDKKLHQEHFISVTAGGEYTHDNIIPACQSCNSSKGNKDFFIWYKTSNCFDKQREKKIMRFLHYTGSAQQLTLCSGKEGE